MSEETPLLTHEEFLAVETIKALVELYKERGAEGDREQVLLRAQRDWGKLALTAAKDIAEPERFEPDVVECGGVEYRLFGVYHGLIGGNDPTYKEFVDTPLRELELTVFENALGYFYPAKESVTIPDFVVLGSLGSIRVGLQVGLIFPELLFEGVRELVARVFKIGGSSGGEGIEAFEFSPRYHAVDVETRRGLDEPPLLPSRLQIDHDMAEWDARGWRAGWSDYFAVVPRSMFMAGFAKGLAEARGVDTLSLVVGDLHNAEIQRFLEREDQHDHRLFRWGETFGRRSKGARAATAAAWKSLHLGLAGFAGCVILVPAIILIYMALVWIGLLDPSS